MNKIYSCSTVDLVLMSETTLTQSPIVQYLSILDLVILLSCYQVVLLNFIKITYIIMKTIIYITKNLTKNQSGMSGRNDEVLSKYTCRPSWKF